MPIPFPLPANGTSLKDSDQGCEEPLMSCFMKNSVWNWKWLIWKKKNWQRWWRMSKTLSGRTGITFLPQRYYESNKEKLSNRQTEKYPQEMVISSSSDFREGWVSQMLVLSLSSSLVVNLQRRRLSKPEAWNALIILFFSPFSFSSSCQKKKSIIFVFPKLCFWSL